MSLTLRIDVATLHEILPESDEYWRVACDVVVTENFLCELSCLFEIIYENGGPVSINSSEIRERETYRTALKERNGGRHENERPVMGLFCNEHVKKKKPQR